MAEEPDLEAMECGHDGAVEVLGVRGGRTGALGDDVVADPLHRALALDWICG